MRDQELTEQSPEEIEEELQAILAVLTDEQIYEVMERNRIAREREPPK